MNDIEELIDACNLVIDWLLEQDKEDISRRSEKIDIMNKIRGDIEESEDDEDDDDDDPGWIVEGSDGKKQHIE